MKVKELQANKAYSRLGVRAAFLAFSWLAQNPVSRATPHSHPKRLTLAVGRLEAFNGDTRGQGVHSIA